MGINRGQSASTSVERPVHPLLCRLIDLAHAEHVKQLRKKLSVTRVGEEFKSRVREAAKQVYRPISAHTTGSGDSLPLGVTKNNAYGESGNRCLEISCQYDSRVQRAEWGRRGKIILQATTHKQGPVWHLFNWYAKRDAFGVLRKVEARHGLAPEADANFVMNMNEVKEMLEDFGICPKLVGRSDIMMLFKASEAADRMEEELSCKPGEIGFAGFVHMLIRVALTGFVQGPGGARYATPYQKIVALMKFMDIGSKDVRHLRARLAGYDRFANDRTKLMASRRWEYVASTSRSDPHRIRVRSAGPRSRDIHLETSDGSSVLDEATAAMLGHVPEHLIALLLRNDITDADEPEWAEFHQPSIFIPATRVGVKRRYRVLVRNRSMRTVGIHVKLNETPFLSANYSEKPLVPGIPRVIELSAVFSEPGEWLGCINLSASSIHGDFDNEEKYAIPVYATGIEEATYLE